MVATKKEKIINFLYIIVAIAIAIICINSYMTSNNPLTLLIPEVGTLWLILLKLQFKEKKQK
jgi:hypothetical protein